MSQIHYLGALFIAIVVVDSFSPGLITDCQRRTKLSPVLHSARAPSKVTDPSGPTIEAEPEEFPEIEYESLPEANYDESNIPIPHQPWRRGETVGCEDPIDAEWRKEAEKMIEMGVQIVGGTYIDTTWYLTSVVVTVGMDFQGMTTDLLREGGPEIRIDATTKPMYYDPDDPNPKDIDFEEDQDAPFFERDLEAEQTIANRTYAKADAEEGESDDPENLGLDPEDDIPLYVDKEFREDLALRASELRALRETKMDEPVDWDDMFWFDKSGPEHKKHYGEKVNTAALSTIAGSILDALKEREEELQVISRHEVVLASPSNPRALDTQKKFDAAIGKRVAVRTHDPWESNRSLYGVLIDRNTLDVYINQKGRLVTIPNNFVSGVELMLTDEEEEDLEAEELYLMEEDGLTEDEAHSELMKRRIAEFEAELEADMEAAYEEEEDYDEDEVEDDDGIEEEEE